MGFWKKTLRKASFYFFWPKKLLRLFILKERYGFHSITKALFQYFILQLMLCSSVGINYEDLLLSWVKSKSNIYFVLFVNLLYYARRRWLSRCFVSQRGNIYAFLVSLTRSAICGGDVPVKTIIFFRVIFWTLVLKNSTLEKFAYVWQIEQMELEKGSSTGFWSMEQKE